MDSITHLALGACTGELLLGKKMGKKAMLLGALAANLPDVDILTGFFVQGDKALLLHRGITHSFFFAVVCGLLLALVAKKIWPVVRFGQWALFFCFEIALHDLLDTCTSYGTGLLEPFTHTRFSFHLLYVADPLFTIGLLVASVYLLWGKRRRAAWATTAIALSGLYVCIAIGCKAYIKTPYSTPAPFTTLLWFCINKTDSGYYTGYSSVFDKRPVIYTYHPKNNSLLKTPQPNLVTFADGYYTVNRANDTTYFNILRFGQIQGWQNGNAPFALSYPLNVGGDNNMIIQKGRLRGWNAHTITQYLQRIMGKQQ